MDQIVSDKDRALIEELKDYFRKRAELDEEGKALAQKMREDSPDYSVMIAEVRDGFAHMLDEFIGR